MGRRRLVAGLGAAVALVVATGVTIAAVATGPPSGSGSDGPAAAHDCGDGALPLARTLSNGATWQMCWSAEPDAGLVLEDVAYAPPGEAPVQVFVSLTLGQLEVPYDTGRRTTEDITDQGFGGRHLRDLTEAECPGARLRGFVARLGPGSEGSERPVLCEEVVDGGVAFRAEEAGRTTVGRRTDLRLSTVSKVGWYEYVTQYTFGADGSVRPALGATGDLSPADFTDDPAHGWPVGPGESDRAVSHAHNVVWRVHWGLGGPGGAAGTAPDAGTAGGLVVEQYDAEPTGETGPRAPVLAGGLTRIATEQVADAADRRWWRVVNPAVRNADDHAVSYEIDLGATDSFAFTADHHDGHGGYDVAFTQADDCQRFATANRDGHCGSGVPDFAADGETLDDVVSWVAVGFHHVPRDEDQSPMELHWQGFTMAPRDLTAQRGDVPAGHEHVNGDVLGDG
ncbi:copper amine oxidase [Antribacter gilvus]|uniref:copper amine oxidase n=1 Tax=Antribacter gilvus TaxID=2304675 RepID=UPI000F7A6A9A|nr:copper amine oxidase [Antribacter gilvus]